MGGTSSTHRSMDTQEEVPEGNGFIFFGQMLPAEMCQEIFLNVPACDLIRSLPRVCRSWHHLLTDRKFWFQKLEKEGFKLSEAVEKRLYEEVDDGKVIRILQGISGGFLPFNYNLICNPSGKEEFKHWIVKHGGDSWKVECPPVGSNSIPEEAGLPTQHCFVSSYLPCFRSQTIILKELGIDSWMMDTLRPVIKVSEWVSARWDCDSKSQTSVKLFRGATGPFIRNMTWSTHHDGVLHREWYQMKMDILYDTYTSELTAIEFTNVSSDLQFWAGHYGAKTAGSSVILQL